MIVKPGEAFAACIQIAPDIVGGNRVYATLKDSNGNAIDGKNATRLGDSMLYCADFTAPSAEGKYYIDFEIVDPQGNLVEELPDELVIVSSTNIEAKLDEILSILNNEIKPKVNDIDSKVTDVQNKINNDVMNKLSSIESIVTDILKWVKIRKC